MLWHQHTELYGKLPAMLSEEELFVNLVGVQYRAAVIKIAPYSGIQVHQRLLNIVMKLASIVQQS